MRYSRTRPDPTSRQTASDLSPDGYEQSPAYRRHITIGQRSQAKPAKRERSRSRDRDQREERERAAAAFPPRITAAVDLDSAPELNLRRSETSSPSSKYPAANFFSRDAINRESLPFILASASVVTTVGIFSLVPASLGMPSPKNATGTAEAATLAASELSNDSTELSAKTALGLSKLTL